MKSTKTKTKAEIEKIRKLRKEGYSLRSISRTMHFSINTIRKVVRMTNGYEGNKFNKAGKFLGKRHSAPLFISGIDGEQLHYQRSNSDYPRVSVNKQRHLLHIYEAKKAYKILKMEWPKKAVVHHVNYDKADFSPENIVVFSGVGDHQLHHAKIEEGMYKFLESHNLLEDFFRENPSLKQKTLKDLLDDKAK